MVITDSLFYGRLIIAPFNIVKYNVLGGAGPSLYGTEPFSFYLVNGFLNFNFVWVSTLYIYIYFHIINKYKTISFLDLCFDQSIGNSSESLLCSIQK